MRHEIDDDEYAEVREDTLEQLKEFDAQLNRMAQGDLTLVSELGSIKLALEAAVREAFKTPEVIRLFARKEPTALRGRLARLGQENRLGHLADSTYRQQAVEVIVALKRLGEEVSWFSKHSCLSSIKPLASFPLQHSSLWTNGSFSTRVPIRENSLRPQTGPSARQQCGAWLARAEQEARHASSSATGRDDSDVQRDAFEHA